MLEVKNLKFSYKKNTKKIFEDLEIKFMEGFNVILGPNGAGKSTLMKSIFGLLDCEGEIFFGFQNITKMNIDEKLELMSYLPQMDLENSDLTVLEMILLGRLPDLKTKVTDEDLKIVTETMEALNIQDLALKIFTHLSGGQKKLVFIAQTLVRYPKVLLLDEPTNSLDLQKQLELCHLLKKLIKDRELELVVIIHDINLAAKYADYIVVISSKGEVYNTGKPSEVITEKMLREVYGVVASVSFDKDGRPIISAEKSVRD